MKDFLKNKFKLNLQLFGDDDPQLEAGSNPQPTPEEVIDIKKNFVRREELEAANKKYDTLVKGILEGQTPDLGGDESKPDISKLRKELYHSEEQLSNLEVVSKTLQLRQAIIDEGGDDPFLPTFAQASPTQADIDAAQRVAKLLQEAVDKAEGDEAAFNASLNKLIR